MALSFGGCAESKGLNRQSAAPLVKKNEAVPSFISAALVLTLANSQAKGLVLYLS